MTEIPEVPDSIQVLNAVVRVGDTVAIAVREGNLVAQRVGFITRFEYRKGSYGGGPVLRLKIRVTHSSSSYARPGTDTGTEIFDRVVKIESASSSFGDRSEGEGGDGA